MDRRVIVWDRRGRPSRDGELRAIGARRGGAVPRWRPRAIGAGPAGHPRHAGAGPERSGPTDHGRRSSEQAPAPSDRDRRPPGAPLHEGAGPERSGPEGRTEHPFSAGAAPERSGAVTTGGTSSAGAAPERSGAVATVGSSVGGAAPERSGGVADEGAVPRRRRTRAIGTAGHGGHPLHDGAGPERSGPEGRTEHPFPAGGGPERSGPRATRSNPFRSRRHRAIGARARSGPAQPADASATAGRAGPAKPLHLMHGGAFVVPQQACGRPAAGSVRDHASPPRQPGSHREQPGTRQAPWSGRPEPGRRRQRCVPGARCQAWSGTCVAAITRSASTTSVVQACAFSTVVRRISADARRLSSRD